MPPRCECSSRSLGCLRKIRQASLALAEQDEGIGEVRGGEDGREKQIVLSRYRQAPLKERHRGLNLATQGMDVADVAVRNSETRRVLDVGRDLQCLASRCEGLREVTHGRVRF